MLDVSEEGWLTGGEPFPLLAVVRDRASARKLRLFACACVRQVWSSLIDVASQRSVEVAERFADGLASREDLTAVHEQALEVARLADLRTTASDQSWAATRAAARVSDPASDLFRTASGSAFIASISAAPWQFDELTGTAAHRGDPAVKAAARRVQCDLLREIFGNPFRPVTVEPAWLGWNGGTVAHLAEDLYQGRRFDELPVLADALEEAGCPQGALLEHLRGPGPHLRGCWALDLVLAR